MNQLLMGESPLDNEIANIRTQIEALRHRRSLLSHTLLSSRKLKSQLTNTNPTAKLPRASLDTANDLIIAHEHTTIANLHRTCSGITAFRVQDPDPNAVDAGNVLGIRFDVFATEQRVFETPYYVLLNQPEGDGRLKVHKHTIPVFVPMQALVKKHLPYTAATDGEEDAPVKAGSQVQELPKFVRALRKELVAHHKRVEALECLKKGVGKRHGVEGVKMLDPSGKEIEISFSKNIIARLRVADDGTIEKVAVGPAPSSSAERNHDAGVMKSHREIKRLIDGGGGRIDDLVERLRTRAVA